MDKAKAAKEISQILVLAARIADDAAMPFLGYLIRMAELEAQKEAAK